MLRRCLTAVAIASLALVAPPPLSVAAAPKSPVPDAAWLALIDDGQAATIDLTGRDSACVADCAKTRDDRLSQAERLRAARDYSAGNCWPFNGNNCVAPRNQCQAACAAADTACRAACNDTFQSCCAANMANIHRRDYDACVVQYCPPKKAAATSATTATERGATRATSGPASATERRKALAPLLDAVGKKPTLTDAELSALTQEAFDAMRRELAFEQVVKGLAAYRASYAVVSGANGRLWIVKADGTARQLDADLSAQLRAPTRPEELIERNKTIISALSRMGIDRVEAIPLFNAAQAGLGTQTFPTGDVLFCRDPTMVASSEHYSIKGTINGSGDFI